MAETPDTIEAEVVDDRKEVTYRDDDPNLALTFPEEELKLVADKILKDFDKAFDSTEEYRERAAKNWAILAGELPPKDFPYPEAANVHVPFMLETLSRLQPRLASEIFGKWEGPLHYISTDPETDDLADLVEAHSSWQFREGIPDFKRQMNRALFSFINQGDVTVYSSYDKPEKRNRHETLSVDEWIVPYTMTTTAPDWSDVPYTCRILMPYKHELEALIGEWHGVEKVIEKEASWEDEPETKVADKAAETQGTKKDEETKAPYKTILYEGWMKLPGQERHRFIQARVHKASGTVFTLAIHEMPDWRDKERVERQMKEKETYISLTQQHQMLLAQADQSSQQLMAEIQTPGIDPGRAEAMYGQMVQAQQTREKMQNQAPMPPDWMDPNLPPEGQEPAEVKMVPIHLAAHAVAIEPMVGNVGLGLGRMLADYNRSGNTALSQYIDQATLSGCWGLITSDIVKFKEKFMVKPGFINKVTGLSMAQVKDNIMELKGPPPSDALLRVVTMVGEYAQQVAQAPEVLSGEPGKSGETYRGMATRIDQAVKQMGYLAQEFGGLLTQVGRNNMLLNSMFLDEQELFPFIDPVTRKGSTKTITRAAYDRRLTIELRSDVQFSSRQQRIQEANDLMGMVANLPPLQQNPAFVYQSIVKYLKAKDMTEMIPFLGAPPPPPQTFIPPPQPGVQTPGPPGSTGKPAGPKNPMPQLPGVPGPGGQLPAPEAA